jgi:chemotaxis protein MotB
LKPEGQRVLEKIASVLMQHTNRQVHVIGHTDDVPIHRKFASNWELSTARATAAVRFLQERAGVDPRRLGALGYGEFHPAVPNTTAEGRAKNRRIEVVILPEEFAVKRRDP